MPILPRRAGILRTVPDAIEAFPQAMLPDASQIIEDGAGSSLATRSLNSYGVRSVLTAQGAGQIALANLTGNTGIPLDDVFDETLPLFETDPVRDALDVIGGRMLDVADVARGAAESMLRPLMDVALGAVIDSAVGLVGNIPVAGWIVRAVVGVVRFIKFVVQAAREQKNYSSVIESVIPPLVFDPDEDRLQLNLFLEVIRGSRDWSRMYGPPASGGPPRGQNLLITDPVTGQQKYVKVAWRQGAFGYSKIKDTNGYRITTSWVRSTPEGNPFTNAGWSGMVPGAAVLHQGIDSPRGIDVYDVGNTLYPSSRNLLFWLWKWIVGKGQRVSPAMYCIDTQELLAWEGYIETLKEYVLFNDKLSKDQIGRIVTTYRDSFGWEQSTTKPVLIARDLEKRQRAFLDTLMVAYVDESYAAITGSMKEKWEGRRRDLLQHPDRCLVDLENVPDESYRAALRDAGVGKLQCQIQGGKFATTLTTVPGFATPMRPPEAAGGAAGIEGSGAPKKKGYAPILLGGLAAAGAIYLTTRKRG